MEFNINIDLKAFNEAVEQIARVQMPMQEAVQRLVAQMEAAAVPMQRLADEAQRIVALVG